MYNRLGTSDTLHKTICCIGPGLCIMPEVNFAFWRFYAVRWIEDKRAPKCPAMQMK
jgi:hypothetical protein